MENHIEIDKENIDNLQYRFRANPGGPKVPQRNRSVHGALLRQELASSITAIDHARIEAGITVENLLVLELSGSAKAPDIDLLQSKFEISVVEEVSGIDDTTKLVVQFSQRVNIDAFERERSLWESDTKIPGVLTYAQRRDLFACIEGIRSVSPEDRTGTRLADAINNDELPDGLFTVDIDIWYNGDIQTRTQIENDIGQALGTGGSTLLGDLFVLPGMLLGRARVNRFTLEVLRKLDLISMVDFPMGALSEELRELYDLDNAPVVDGTLDDTAPLACIIDSGVFTGNPLLATVIVGEEDFDTTENTASDLNGHGTGVAGIVVYGNFQGFDSAAPVFKPLVRICNAKVMHNDNGNPKFNDDKRPEELVKDAVRYFHDKYGCRIFNLSAGNADRVYGGGRQMIWASLLDELARDLDIVIVVSAGNVSEPEIPVFTSREDLMGKIRNQLLDHSHRLIDPATTAIGITVGTITRNEEPETYENRSLSLSVGMRDYPSAFTRTGQGVNGAIKPEFVDYGGNYAIHQIISPQTRWQKNNRALLEPILSNRIDQFFAGNAGTSFSAPHVTHIAARIERALEIQLGEKPSANLIRALLASSAKSVRQEWLEQSTPPNFTGTQRKPQEWRLQLCGYGKIEDTTLFSDRNHVTLFTEDALDLRQIHLYKIPVPKEFLSLKTNKRISIGFAYNPPTRLSRKDYIANSLWFEVFRRIDAETLLNYKGKKAIANEEEAEQIIERFSAQYGAPFNPGYTKVNTSTLQQRVWEAGSLGGKALLWEDHDPFIYVLVTGKARFKHAFEANTQPYAMAITFSYESEEEILLRQKISSQVRVKERKQVRVRPQIQV